MIIDDQLINNIENYLEVVFADHQSRLKHIYNVKKVAVALGKMYEADVPSVIVASYLHDATKNLSNAENVTLAGNLYDGNIPLACLHAYSACNLARTRFNIDDDDILNAIKYHCSGRKAMSLLEKIIFVSDFIEEGRDFVDDDFRKLAIADLDKAVLLIMLRTKNYILEQKQAFSSLTEEAIQYYQRKLEDLND